MVSDQAGPILGFTPWLRDAYTAQVWLATRVGLGLFNSILACLALVFHVLVASRAI